MARAVNLETRNLTAGGLLAAGFLAAVYILTVSFTGAREAAANLRTDQQRLTEVRSRANIVDGLKAEISRLNAVDPSGQGFLVAANAQEAAGRLQQRINQAAQENRANIVSMRVDDAHALEGPVQIGAEFALVVPGERTERIVADIEKGPLAIIVDSLRLDASAAATEGTVRLDLRLHAFVWTVETPE